MVLLILKYSKSPKIDILHFTLIKTNFYLYDLEMAGTSNTLNPLNWISTYSDELYGYAMNKTSAPEIAEDLVQETFLAGLKSKENFKGLSSERTWLFTILKFKIADHYRKASTKFEIPNSKFGHEGSDSYTDSYFDDEGNWKDRSGPKDWFLDHSKTIENKELGLALNHCIDKLPDNQKQLILLKLVEEEETEKVCKDLNITATNYWVIIHRAKLQLRSCLEKNWFKA